ncbi:tRNA(Arg) A34 adenosine deaminase TadA [Endobacter medicaginis]|uniref:Nucleoside deaminase n=1 Tax=Endobacter medicaginis TaxID=1181271 RepID=A0A839UYB0_9PROT|nr:nucleoside deaminase [Endobacter medicaginis]MBB3174837.1 tRNA(Arg) A34 adenosine deaminase TadA [Endobacter medicaginis]MCX5475631.1 nucleoside deaminase [Endobacter medicaginis]NVN29117.1 nucleoside deaminase [Endobacter medicaginis]
MTDRTTDLDFLRLSNEVGRRATTLGHHPFGAVLVGPDRRTVLMTQCNIDTVNHAESTLARIAASNWPAEVLWDCTLYTAVEPCCMCAGTIYWANIGRVVYGMSEKRLLECTGDHPENPTMSLPSATVFAHGQKPITLEGPFPEIEAETLALQRDFWSTR